MTISHNWNKPQIFTKESNLYLLNPHGTSYPESTKHIYMQWDESIEDEYMFRLKKTLSSSGKVYIPFMKKNGVADRLSHNEISSFQQCLKNQVESHLLMACHNSIHIFNIVALKHSEDLKKEKKYLCPYNDMAQETYSLWIEVDDLFVLQANHQNNPFLIQQALDQYLIDVHASKIFNSQLINAGESIDEYSESGRWVDQKRSLTYEYFIKSCELKDNIYQDNWGGLNRKTRHLLVESELMKSESLLKKNEKKLLSQIKAFNIYHRAVYIELNELYVFPLVNAIQNFEPLNEAWANIKTGLVDKNFLALLEDLITEKKSAITSLEEFEIFVSKAKSFLFTVKTDFTRKIHRGDFLTIENFLSVHESLVEGRTCKEVLEKLSLLDQIHCWSLQIMSDINLNQFSQESIQKSQLKLSYLVSLMGSANYEENVLFKIIEEKTSRSSKHKSFEQEVKSLLSIEFKKVA